MTLKLKSHRSSPTHTITALNHFKIMKHKPEPLQFTQIKPNSHHYNLESLQIMKYKPESCKNKPESVQSKPESYKTSLIQVKIIKNDEIHTKCVQLHIFFWKCSKTTILASSTEFHGIPRTFHGLSTEFHGIPRSSTESHGLSTEKN